MKEFYFGAHLSNANNIFSTMKELIKINGNCMQIFVSNPIATNVDFTKKINYYKDNSKKIQDFTKDNNIKIIIHGPYTLNFAKSFDINNLSWWITRLWNELIIAEYIGAIGVVIHVGKYLNLTVEEGINNMIESFNYIINKLQNNNMKTSLILETAAGQGSELLVTDNNDLTPFINFYNKFTNKQKKNFKLCIDTCHIFSAGYDIRKKNQVIKLFKTIDNDINFNNIALFHLNDSKTKYSSKVDRHANLGEGEIGWKGILQVIKQSYNNKIPIILETPTNYIQEINIINKIINKLK